MRLLLVPLLLVSCGAVAGEAPPAPPPAPPATTAQRAADITAQHRRFMDWALVEAFRRVGGEQAWRGEAESFLGEIARCVSEQRPTPPALIAQGRALIAAGCDDPLVRLRLGILLGGESEGRALVSGSIAPLRARLGTPQAYPAIHLVSALRRQVDKRGRPTAEALDGLRAIAAQACQEAQAAPVGRAIAVDGLVDWLSPLVEGDGGLPRDAAAALLDLCGAGGGDPALIGVLRGSLAIRAAWDARGGGWANSVTEEGWKGFREGLAQARGHLEAAWRELPEASSAAALMITVAMGDGSGEEAAWFARATAADPACESAWSRMRNATLPRWGGSTRALLKLAAQAVVDARPGNRLQPIAASALWTYVDESDDENSAWLLVSALDANCPPPAGPGADFRAMGVAWASDQRERALERFAALGGLRAPEAAWSAAPFGRQRAWRLLGALERARLGQTAPKPRPIPADGTPHRIALHGASLSKILPALWQRHGAADPARSAQIQALLADPNRASATALRDAGSADPLVRWLSVDTARSGPEHRAELLACWDALEAAGYPPVVPWQPAWFLMRELGGDKGAAAEVARLRPRYAALAAALARSVGAEGVDAGLVIVELADPPHDSLRAEILQAAAEADVPIAAAVSGFAALAKAGRTKDRGQRAVIAWSAVGDLWTAWNSARQPRLAAALATAACLAEMPDEGRCWFDEAVRLGYDDARTWNGLIDGYAMTGSPDELLALGAEIAALPPSDGPRVLALWPVHSVLRNRHLHTRERLASAWETVDRVSAAALGDPASPLRRDLLHWRLAVAALRGDQAAITAAATALGGPVEREHLPAGLDHAKILAAIEAAQPSSAPAPQGAPDF